MRERLACAHTQRQQHRQSDSEQTYEVHDVRTHNYGSRLRRILGLIIVIETLYVVKPLKQHLAPLQRPIGDCGGGAVRFEARGTVRTQESLGTLAKGTGIAVLGVKELRDLRHQQLATSERSVCNEGSRGVDLKVV